jgi:hypothetical protein
MAARTFTFTSTNKEIFNEISYYVSNYARQEWSVNSAKIIKITDDKNDNSNNLVEITRFIDDDGDRHRYEHTRTGFLTSLISNIEYYIEFENNSFTFIQTECGNRANEDFNGVFEYYKRIHMTTEAPENIINKLLIDAKKLYNQDVKNLSETKNKTSVFIFDEGYWELLTTMQKRPMNTIYLPKVGNNCKDARGKNIDIVSHLENFLDPKTKSKMEQLGIPYKCNYLLEGHWGTGKTSLIKGLATKFDYGISILPFSSKLGDVELFKAIRKIRNDTFLVLEDIDSLFINRKEGDTHKNRITFSGLLNILDGITTASGLITFMTTNHKSKLDPALIRPGRIDYVMTFKFIQKEQFINMFYNFSGIENEEEKKQKGLELWKAYRNMGDKVKLTTGLLQQYLFKYLEQPDKMIENIDEISDMYECLNEEKDGGGNMFT